MSATREYASPSGAPSRARNGAEAGGLRTTLDDERVVVGCDPRYSRGGLAVLLVLLVLSI